MVDKRRVRALKQGVQGDGPVIYLLSRDQRVDDNWALLLAQELAIERKQPLVVACPVAADYSNAPQRQIDFIMRGLSQVEARLARLRVPFVATTAPPVKAALSLIRSMKAGALVTDFSPLKESRKWKTALARKINIPFLEVDAHNIIPCWQISGKQEYAAYTLRPKIQAMLHEFLSAIPSPFKHPFAVGEMVSPSDWNRAGALVDSGRIKGINRPFEAGEKSAVRQLNRFLTEKLERYGDTRNDPTASGQSNLSPYLHFGQLSAQRVVLEAQRYDGAIASQEAFLEELIVRRELADNFCFYNEKYDSFEGFPQWARGTLDKHRSDARAYLYDRDTLECAATHDVLWNAAQTEMAVTGKMHGYMRMYWAKKMLEWSPSPEEALADAIYLNNRHELDGNDPNGYAGIAWSIGGVHDRAWSEREIFGKVRYMSFEGCKRKFSVTDYVERITELKSDVTARL